VVSDKGRKVLSGWLEEHSRKRNIGGGPGGPCSHVETQGMTPTLETKKQNYSNQEEGKRRVCALKANPKKRIVRQKKKEQERGETLSKLGGRGEGRACAAHSIKPEGTEGKHKANRIRKESPVLSL